MAATEDDFDQAVIDAIEKEELRYEREQLVKSMSKQKRKTNQITSYFVPLSSSKIVDPVHPTIYVAKYSSSTRKSPDPPEGATNILIHTSAKTIGGALSPYNLKTPEGWILENVWQFSKIYPRVTPQRTSKSAYESWKIIWEYGFEKHYDITTDTVCPEYWSWREKGYQAEYAVRYPNGFDGRRECLFSLWPVDHADASLTKDKYVVGCDGKTYEKLTYIEARKRIYCKLYRDLVRNHPEFSRLRKMIQSGKVLQISEVDGPNVDWFKDSPIKNYIVGKSLLINEKVIRYLIECPSYPFGHGYAIAALLIGGEDWIK